MEVTGVRALAFLTYSEAVRIVEAEKRGRGLKDLVREGKNPDRG